MPARSFTGPDGQRWTVWEVIPGQYTTSQRVSGVHVPAEMAEGWLAFEGAAGKRRMYPIPPGWDQRRDEELAALCQAAEPVTRRRTEDAGE
ncbi:MAG TPA: hypothetical protein VHG93_10570 [Longimicrobium sp.]|nr:hypothetical protein [Longimicrobium sp.]